MECNWSGFCRLWSVRWFVRGMISRRRGPRKAEQFRIRTPSATNNLFLYNHFIWWLSSFYWDTKHSSMKAFFTGKNSKITISDHLLFYTDLIFDWPLILKFYRTNLIMISTVEWQIPNDLTSTLNLAFSMKIWIWYFNKPREIE